MTEYNEIINDDISINRKIKQIIIESKTPYQEYKIVDTKDFGKCLIIDDDLQSAEYDEALYHELLVHPAMLLHENPETVLIMGGGEGATLREVLKYKSVKKVIMIDIDGDLVEACKKYLESWHQGSFEDSRAEVKYMDIMAFLEDNKVKFDVVIGDLVDISAHEDNEMLYSLYNEKLYGLLKKSLNDNYIVSSQAGDLTKLKSHNYIRKEFRSNFGKVFSYGSFIPSFFAIWGFVISSNRNISDISDKFNSLNLELSFMDKDDFSRISELPSFIAKNLK